MGAVLVVLLVAMPQEAQYLVHFSAFQSLAAAEEVAVFLAQMRLLTLPRIHSKMARLVAQEAAVLVTVHPHLYQMAVAPACQDKDLPADQVEIRRLPPA